MTTDLATTTPNAIAAQQRSERPTTVAQYLARPDTVDMLSKSMSTPAMVTQLHRAIATAVRKNPKLGECTVESFAAAATECAQMGLMPGPMGHVFLIPRRRRFKEGNTWKSVDECTAQRGYVGDVELIMRSGQIASVQANIVYEKEIESGAFSIDIGDRRKPLTHRVCLTGNRGRAALVYAMISPKDETIAPIIGWMTREEIEAFRNEHAPRDYDDKTKITGPWERTGAEPGLAELEMWKKTVIRRVAKLAPKSDAYAEALEREYAREADERQAGRTQIYDATGDAPGPRRATDAPPASRLSLPPEPPAVIDATQDAPPAARTREPGEDG